MGVCCSKNNEEFKKSETPVYPLPVISPTDAHTGTIFDPEFNPTQKKGKTESVPLLDEQTAPKPPEPKKEEDLSDSSPIDQKMISELLAEVDTSDLSN